MFFGPFLQGPFLSNLARALMKCFTWLRAHAPSGSRAKVGLKQLHDRADDRKAWYIDLLALGFQPGHEILFQQREKHDAGRFLDFVQHAIELLLAAHQRIDMLDRGHVGILRGHRPRHRDQGFTGRIGDQVKVKITAGRRHRDPCISCESLWTLPERNGRGSADQG